MKTKFPPSFQVATLMNNTHHALVERETEMPNKWHCIIFSKEANYTIILVAEVFGSTGEGVFLEACKKAKIDHESMMPLLDWMEFRRRNKEAN